MKYVVNLVFPWNALEVVDPNGRVLPMSDQGVGIGFLVVFDNEIEAKEFVEETNIDGAEVILLASLRDDEEDDEPWRQRPWDA